MLRPVIAAGSQARESARVARVAAILDESPSQIRRMLARGDLEGHRTGKRGVRIYLDSVADWQAGHALGKPQKAVQKPDGKAKAPMSRATRAAHGHAMASLQALGLVPASRP